MGFPLVSERLNGQARWRLIEGFKDIPVLGFSATELMALTFSRKLSTPLEGTEITDELGGWIWSFGSQVRVVKPDALREKVQQEAKE